MNILVIAHDASMYGASQSLLTALKGITTVKNRRVLVLLPYGGKLEEALYASGIDYKIMSFPRCVEPQRKAKSFVKRLKKTYHYYKKVSSIFPELKKIANEFKPDVIYTNTSVVSIGFMLSKRSNLPHVWHIREFGDIDYNFTYFPTKRYIANCISKSQRIIFGSQALRNAWLGFNASNSSVVYNGIFENLLKFESRHLSAGPKRIGMLGGIMPGKGQDVAIKAFASVVKLIPNCSLFLYGDKVDKVFYDSLVTLAQQLRIEDKVFIKDFESDKDKIFKNLDVLLNCSKMEGFGRTIVEAMMRGVPVIGNRSGGIVEIIDDKVDGLLFNGTADDLAENIESLLSKQDLYHSLSHHGLNKAKKFSIPEYVESIDNILIEAATQARQKT